MTWAAWRRWPAAATAPDRRPISCCTLLGLRHRIAVPVGGIGGWQGEVPGLAGQGRRRPVLAARARRRIADTGSRCVRTKRDRGVGGCRRPNLLSSAPMHAPACLIRGADALECAPCIW